MVIRNSMNFVIVTIFSITAINEIVSIMGIIDLIRFRRSWIENFGPPFLPDQTEPITSIDQVRQDR